MVVTVDETRYVKNVDNLGTKREYIAFMFRY